MLITMTSTGSFVIIKVLAKISHVIVINIGWHFCQIGSSYTNLLLHYVYLLIQTLKPCITDSIIL